MTGQDKAASLVPSACSHGRPDHQMLIRQLAEALGLDLPAMTATPEQVWNGLIQRVERVGALERSWQSTPLDEDASASYREGWSDAMHAALDFLSGRDNTDSSGPG